MDDDGIGTEDLRDATQALCDAFADLFEAADPKDGSRDNMIEAARKVGSRSKRVLYTIEEEDVADGINQNVLNDLVQVVASSIAKMTESAKDLASGCQDDESRHKVEIQNC